MPHHCRHTSCSGGARFSLPTTRFFHSFSARGYRSTESRGRRPWSLLYPLDFLIAAILMQRRGGGAAILAGLEADLRVHYFEEKFLFAFGEDFELRLIGELREHAGALARERQCDGRRELIDAGVAVEDLGVERD